MLKASLLLFLTFSLLAPPPCAAGRQKAAPNEGAAVDAAALGEEVKDFLGAELSAHLADIKSLDPPPPRVLGAGSTTRRWGGRTAR